MTHPAYNTGSRRAFEGALAAKTLLSLLPKEKWYYSIGTPLAASGRMCGDIMLGSAFFALFINAHNIPTSFDKDGAMQAGQHLKDLVISDIKAAGSTARAAAVQTVRGCITLARLAKDALCFAKDCTSENKALQIAGGLGSFFLANRYLPVSRITKAAISISCVGLFLALRNENVRSVVKNGFQAFWENSQVEQIRFKIDRAKDKAEEFAEDSRTKLVTMAGHVGQQVKGIRASERLWQHVERIFSRAVRVHKDLSGEYPREESNTSSGSSHSSTGGTPSSQEPNTDTLRETLVPIAEPTATLSSQQYLLEPQPENNTNYSWGPGYEPRIPSAAPASQTLLSTSSDGSGSCSSSSSSGSSESSSTTATTTTSTSTTHGTKATGSTSLLGRVYQFTVGWIIPRTGTTEPPPYSSNPPTPSLLPTTSAETIPLTPKAASPATTSAAASTSSTPNPPPAPVVPNSTATASSDTAATGSYGYAWFNLPISPLINAQSTPTATTPAAVSRQPQTIASNPAIPISNPNLLPPHDDYDEALHLSFGSIIPPRSSTNAQPAQQNSSTTSTTTSTTTTSSGSAYAAVWFGSSSPDSVAISPQSTTTTSTTSVTTTNTNPISTPIPTAPTASAVAGQAALTTTFDWTNVPANSPWAKIYKK
jgi:hypothetical protein